MNRQFWIDRLSTGLTALLLLTAACTESRKPSEPAPPEAREVAPGASDEAVVAEGKGVRVTTADVRARIEQMPPQVRETYERAEKKRELVEDLVRFQLLLAEAGAKGLDATPGAQREEERELVARRVRQFMEEGHEQVPEAEVRAYYEENREQFQQPAEVRLEHLFFAAPEGSGERAAMKRRALEQLHALREAERRGEDVGPRFAAAATDGGPVATAQIPFSTREALQKQFSRAFAEAVFQPVAQGAVLDVIETPAGFHLVRRLGTRGAVLADFDSVRSAIAKKLRAQDRARELKAHVAQLSREAGVTYDMEAIKALRVGP